MKQPKKTRQNTSKRLYVESAHGDFKILLPPGAKTTFGPSVPQKRVTTVGGPGGLVVKGFHQYQPQEGNPRFRYALRVYLRSELIAVFTDIFGFRPDDMEVQYYSQDIKEKMVVSPLLHGVEVIPERAGSPVLQVEVPF